MFYEADVDGGTREQAACEHSKEFSDRRISDRFLHEALPHIGVRLVRA